jgi:hypothetical protein
MFISLLKSWVVGIRMASVEFGTRFHIHPLHQAKSVSSVVMTEDMSSEKAKYKQTSINVKPYCRRSIFLVVEASNRLFPKPKRKT